MMCLKKMFVTAAVLAMATSATAAVVSDPRGDFLPSFVGTPDADLDLLSFSAVYDPGNQRFVLGGVVAGTIDPSTFGLYAIGVNTGAGVRRPFAGIGAPNVQFDNVILVRQDGTGLVDSVPTLLLDTLIRITGNAFEVRVPFSALLSSGAPFEAYTFNVWSRNGLGLNSQIADFAPGNAMLAAVPEPATVLLVVLGSGLIATSRRRRASSRRLTIGSASTG